MNRVNPSHDLKIAKFWAKEDSYIHCFLCARHCKIPENQIGFCGVRKVMDGILYTLNYGRLVAMAIDPIEKKPLNHFKPGTDVLSIATVGCNFACQYCLNWDISQRRKITGSYVSPEAVIEKAIENGAKGLSYTYNEPTIFAEYAIDVMKLAHKNGLFNTWVTNGYMTVEALDEIAKYLDAATVDFKGHGNRGFYRKYIYIPDPSPIYDALIVMKEKGVFIEITDLVVPVEEGSSNKDLRKLAKWIVDNLGPETPMHLLRFHPHYRLIDVPPTPVSILEEAVSIAKQEGLEYVYIGNVWGHKLEDTYCPKCGYKVLDREGFYIRKFEITPDSKCPQCGYKLNFIL